MTENQEITDGIHVCTDCGRPIGQKFNLDEKTCLKDMSWDGYHVGCYELTIKRLREELVSLRAQILSEQQYREELCVLAGGNQPNSSLSQRISGLKHDLNTAITQGALLRKVATDAEERWSKSAR